MIAEEGSFTRAAARSGIAQQPLSAQIRQLETEVGAMLFHRLPHGAELSPPGSAFLAVVRGLPRIVERGLNAAQRAARGETGVMTLDFMASSIFNRNVTRVIATFERTYSDVELRLEEANTRRLREGLREGSIDAAFLRPSKEDSHGLTVTALHPEPMIAVLPRSHAHARADAIRLADLADEPPLPFPREVGPRLFDIVLASCRQAGFAPHLGRTTPQIASIVRLAAAGRPAIQSPHDGIGCDRADQTRTNHAEDV